MTVQSAPKARTNTVKFHGRYPATVVSLVAVTAIVASTIYLIMPFPNFMDLLGFHGISYVLAILGAFGLGVFGGSVLVLIVVFSFDIDQKRNAIRRHDFERQYYSQA